MRRFTIYMLSLAVALFSVSCEPNENGGGSELKVNTYSVDGVVGSLESVAVMMVGENISIVATPDQGGKHRGG